MDKTQPSAPGDAAQPIITDAFFTHGDYSAHSPEAPENEPFLAMPRPHHEPPMQQPLAMPGCDSMNVPMGQQHIPYETLQDGRFLSRSMIVNQGGAELHRFLAQRCMIKPKIVIRIRGTRDAVCGFTSKRNKDGTVESSVRTRRVQDFDYEIDCSKYLSKAPEGFRVLPDLKTGEVKTVGQLCEDYVRDPHRIKELQLTKVVDWDTDLVKRALTAAIRRYGYSHTLNIDVETRQHKVLVKPGSRLARAVDNQVLVVLFYITFMWICAWPLLVHFRQRYGHDTLQSIWRMDISEREWCEENADDILGQIPLAGLDGATQLPDRFFRDDTTLFE